jgi:hypothetical protein
VTDPATARPFLEGEIEGLEPFDFLGIAPCAVPLHVLEVARTEDGALQVRVPGRPGVLPELPAEVRRLLSDRGFVSEDAADRGEPWQRDVPDAGAAVDLVRQVLTEVFHEKPDVNIDVLHGSHRAEHEARQKLEALRAQLNVLMAEIREGPCEKDADGDFTIPVDDVHVVVAPRLVPGGITVVRVFSVTNVGVNVTPELGLFLARLNFSLMFGRFALDTEHRSIWFDESLLGDQINADVLRFTIKVVAATADEWDDRLKQMFGGATYQDVKEKRDVSEVPTLKPGTGGYL